MARFVSPIALGAILASGCALQSSPDPKVIGGQFGMLACTAALIEKPGLQPVMVDAVAKLLVAVESPSPTQAVLAEVLAKITDPKTKLIVTALVNSGLTLYPNPDGTNALHPDVVAAIKAVLLGCQGIVGVPTTTTTVTSSTTTTTV